MSPWSEKRGPRWPLFAGIGCVLAGLIGGFLLMYGVDRGADDPDPAPSDASPPPASASSPPSSPSSPSSPSPTAPDASGLTVVSWGQEGGQLAVVVRNDTDEVVERARVLLTARDRSGAAVLSTSGTPDDVCCTVVGLAPGAEFGLFAELRTPLRDVAEVEARPVARDLRTGDGAVPAVRVRDARLRHLPDDTVVTARLTAEGDLSGYVAAQALLVDADGRVVQVVSGRFYCFASGRPGTIRLRLFHTVPRDLRLGRVLAQAIPQGVPPGVPGRC
ncbi:hypothetical protein [Pimelobacter simplex]|uniref:hypothetical protein n=1 Tax=Nocardioides simplex TaxID=2045 RepID=UPI003AADE560